MTKIDPPDWAPEYARHVVETEGLLGERARELASPWLAEIVEELDRRVNEFANDPERCFLNEASGFPLRERLAGTYYIGSEYYEGSDDGPGTSYRLQLFLRCLEKYWHPNQERFGYDYLELEITVNLRPDGTGYEFEYEFDDGGFSTSVI
jgi:hypothetical protein